MLGAALRPGDLVRNVFVPHLMQIVVRAGIAKADGDFIAAAVSVLDVERLVNVTDEMDEVFQRLLAGCLVRAGIEEEACLVGDCVNDATVFML